MKKYSNKSVTRYSPFCEWDCGSGNRKTSPVSRYPAAVGKTSLSWPANKP